MDFEIIILKDYKPLGFHKDEFLNISEYLQNKKLSNDLGSQRILLAHLRSKRVEFRITKKGEITKELCLVQQS